MPLLALLAQLWFKAPQDPEAMLDWPADLVYRMLFYLDLQHQVAAAQQGQEDWSDA